MAAMIALESLLLALLAAPLDDTPAEGRVSFVAPASDEGRLALQGIQRAPDLQIELFAAEPLLANPVAFCADDRGRFYVVETFRLEDGVTDNRQHIDWLDEDLAARTVEERVAMYRRHLPDNAKAYGEQEDRVRVIEDLDGDGKADRAEVFAGGFRGLAEGLAAGVLARGPDVWFTCIPKLWQLRDADGDRRAEIRKPLLDGFGVHVAFIGHDLHGLIFGPDGRLYFSIGDRGFHVESEGRVHDFPDTGAVLRCEPDGSALEVFATGLRNPQELAFNELGDLFTGDNNSDGGDKARWVHVVEGGDSGWRVGYQYLEAPSSRGPWNSEKLWLPRWDGQAAYILPPVANIADGPSGLAYAPGTGLPERCNGRFFLCDFRGVSGLSGVWSLRLEPRGASYALVEREKFVWAVLATDCGFGPDGSLYITDWVTGWSKTGKGRMYRVLDPGVEGRARAEETRKLLAEGFHGRTQEALARWLEHRDQRVRQGAQFALAEMGPTAVPALVSLARDGAQQLVRLHAVWALGQIARKVRSAVAPLASLLAHADSEVRAQAAKLLGELRAGEAHDRMVELLRDPEPRVRFFAATALSKVVQPGDVQPLCDLLLENNDADANIRHGAVLGLAGLRKPQSLLPAAAHSSAAVRLGVLLAGRRLGDPEVARFLADPEPALVLEAARAIYDVPIDAALPALAGLQLMPASPDALAVRVIESNFRLGGIENAEALAAIAAREDLPNSTRAAAVQALAAWRAPQGRDRLLGVWRPYSSRAPQAAASALRPRLAQWIAGGAGAKELRLSAIRAVALLGIRDAAANLVAVVDEPGAGSGVRAEALRALEQLGDTHLLDAAVAAIADPDAEVRMEGQRLLAKLNPEASVTALESALERGALREKQGALGTLAGLALPKATAILSRWLDRLLAGQVEPEVQLDLIEAARARSDASLEEKIARYEATKPADDPLAGYSETVAGGDAAKGRLVFYGKAAVSCQRCHRGEAEGGEVGPNLTGIGSRETRQYLLESIVAPNRKIAKGFDSVTIVTKEGRIYTGVLREENEESVRLTSSEGTLLVVPKDSIQERAGGVSAMPEDLIKFLSKRELRDLVEYLASLK